MKYSDLAAEAVQGGWRVEVLPVVFDCGGFVAMTTIRLLKKKGVQGQALQKAMRSLCELAELGSNWLWL